MTAKALHRSHIPLRETDMRSDRVQSLNDPQSPQRSGSEQVTGLRVNDLTVTFGRGRKAFNVIESLNFEVAAGETLGLVGESGSGKSMTAAALMGWLPWGGRSSGSVQLGDTEITRLSKTALRATRGREVGMIFQNPLSSLNPSLTVAQQIAEPYRLYCGATAPAARSHARQLLQEVGVPDAERRLDDYPHQFSGGMRQRVMIAMALACSPRLLIADEPTTALDVINQAKILRLIQRLQKEHGMAVIFITHDLSLVAEYAQKVMVLYAGKTVEQGPAEDFFCSPRHPYSQALLHAIPRLVNMEERLSDIDGLPPRPQEFPVGCRFAPRCPAMTPECLTAYPAQQGGAHYFYCIHPVGAVS
ncbi:ABC transporter ATP-binding protein [Acidithiobacillus ferrivorans]|uniref:ABC transporter ATP-binding protein n=1 Tax=Acidithiobacillus ferrivorans TaxID=160808 RepID=A0A7T4WG78_9PROT|nr:ABC transporter ATP-binding protein [Acidithiobacillus ferrivorans]MBN6740409.1 ABC transporter ATP-binding protein [Acidithiobacillus sp. MC6.1]QQD73867.1 ABC transporter ATP-binding protein [Acidithiobacillus ferrivorans]